jgi:hypothetical protein
MTADENSTPTPNPRSGILKTTFLLIGSAALGGLAVALWNRRELAEMRNPKSGSVLPEPSTSDTADEEII